MRVSLGTFCFWGGIRWKRKQVRFEFWKVLRVTVKTCLAMVVGLLVVPREGVVMSSRKHVDEVREEQRSFFGKRRSRVRVELVERDLRVLEFILDMKFAGCAEVFEKFFSRVHDGEVLAASHAWTRKRLRQLTQGGFLRAGVGVSGGASVYFATFKAYYALASVYPDRVFPKPTGGLDLRTFVHDRELLAVRMEYERLASNAVWVSDRRLKQGFASDLGLSGVYVPDGLMELPNGSVIALELEIAMKSRERYRDKVARYVRLIRDSRAKPRGLRKVVYRCLREPVFEALSKECRVYGDMFEVVLAKPTVTKLRGAR